MTDQISIHIITSTIRKCYDPEGDGNCRSTDDVYEYLAFNVALNLIRTGHKLDVGQFLHECGMGHLKDSDKAKPLNELRVKQ